MKSAYFARILEALDIPDPVQEYRFHPTRRWRLDYAWPEHKLAVEIEGGAFARIPGRHTRGAGFRSDLEKYNELALAGWSLLRFLPEQINNGQAVLVISRFFGGKAVREI